MPKEYGHTVCQGGKVVALVHSHPSGSLTLSTQDIQTASTHKVVVCIQAWGRTKCFKFKKR
jgi:proteasome lid subunit RPN8/RPN11